MKDAYYFSHDCNAKEDPKCVLLIEQLGLEGYGIFWVLVETLREQPEFKYPINLIPALARKYNTSAEKMKTVIFSYELFLIENDEFFFSESLNRRMEIYIEKRKKLSEAGKKGNQKRWAVGMSSQGDNQAIALRLPGDGKAIAKKEKEKKEKESKENTLFKGIDEDLLKLLPPKDNIDRNWEGLRSFLSSISGKVEDKNHIIRLSNFGEKNHSVWKLIYDIQSSNGGIKQPIAFILSRMT